MSMSNLQLQSIAIAISENEKYLLRELAKQYAELTRLPVQQERILRMQDNNDLKPGRPPVWIHEIPWHEMDIDGQLKLECSNEFARNMEWHFRNTLFRWKYFQADMVVEDFYRIQKKYTSTGNGLNMDEDIIKTDEKNYIMSHRYKDILENEEVLESFRMPVLTVDKDADQAHFNIAEDILRDILPVKLCGEHIYYAPWDTISRLRGVEAILYDLADRPEYSHRIIDLFTQAGLSELEQKEKLGLIDNNTSHLHCTPPYVSELSDANVKDNVTLKNIWIRGTAQIFSSVSPDMHEEFELNYANKLFEKCGLVYYGCCEPLDNKIYKLKKIPNLRKIGVSPWANEEKSGEQISGDYIYARKPNPAHVAASTNKEVIKKETRKTIEVCRKYGCPYEFVLKDISTVSYKPQNLIDWASAVKEVIDEYYC